MKVQIYAHMQGELDEGKFLISMLKPELNAHLKIIYAVSFTKTELFFLLNNMNGEKYL